MIISKTTYEEQVISFIYNCLLKGELKPGDQIKENRLAIKLGISRAPIREALRELISNGIIEYRPRVGNFVMNLSPKDIVDSYITRGVLEGYAARDAIDNFSVYGINRLYKMTENMEELASSGKHIKLIDLGDKFHEMIFSRSGNKQLVGFTKKLSIKSHLMFFRYLAMLYSPSEIGERHKIIVDALKSGNAEQVEACIRSHYYETGTKIANLKETESK